GDRFDLYLDAGDGEARDDRRAGGFGFAEELGVYGVHGREILVVGEEDGALHDVPHRGPAAGEDALDVLQYAAGFGGDIAADELLCGRVDGDLAADEDEIAGAHRGGIGPTRGGNSGGRNALDHV